MKKIPGIILCVTLFMLSGCKDIDDYIGKEGIITGKEYQPAHTTLMPIYNGKTVMIVPQSHPEEYIFLISFVETESTEEIEFCVTENIYNEYEIGDKIVITYEFSF